jgi:hypothetical protein
MFLVSRAFPRISNRRPIGVVVAGVAAFGALAVSAAGQLRPATPEREPRVKELVEWADGLPTEFRADIQLNAVESGRIRGAWAGQILEHLFRDASSAKYAYKERDITLGSNTRQRKLATAFDLNLDALSIRTRVVRAMLNVQPLEARQLLDEIHLGVPSSPCGSPMVYDVSDFYGALETVLSRAFSAAERADGAHVHALAGRIRTARSPFELAPIGGLLARIRVNREQLEWLTSLYTDLLQQVKASDRELAWIERDQSLSKAIQLLAEWNAQQALPVTPLLKAYRGFLVRSTRPASCADIMTDRERVVETFNRLRAEYGATEGVERLRVEDLKAERVAESAQVDLVPAAVEFNGLLRRLMARRAGEARRQPQAEGSDSAGWESDVTEFLEKVDRVDPSRAECHACVFHEKADLLFIFFDFTPGGRFKERILGRLVRFLSTDAMQNEEPLEWLFEVKLLLNLSRDPSEEQLKRVAQLQKEGKTLNMLPSGVRAAILEEMKGSNNYLLYVYANADEILRNEYVMPPF